MNFRLLAAACLVAALPLSGCATGLARMTPEQQVNLVNAFAKAGCSGTVHVSAGGATGQLGGGAHAEVGLDGSCHPASVPAADPPKDQPVT
ncbi:MAG TPA: hypothetical protein VFH92_09225 [Phenylobacterium sp.]|nr:hypothetical protein [Phenylobacterium sp.]